MKLIFIVLISLFSVLASAAPQCGAPLADRAFCASVSGDTKRVAFKSDCTLSYLMTFANGAKASFDGTWSLDGTALSLKVGSEVGVRNLIFGPGMNSFSAEGFPNEVYFACQ